MTGKNISVESIHPVVKESLEIALLTNTTATDRNEESLLIDKYLDVIKTRQDLLTLSAEDRTEIKKVFNSEFRFFSCLQDTLKYN